MVSPWWCYACLKSGIYSKKRPMFHNNCWIIRISFALVMHAADMTPPFFFVSGGCLVSGALERGGEQDDDTAST